MFSLAPPAISAEAVDAAKAYLRIETDEEDVLIAALLIAAIRHAEGFIGQLLLRRSGIDRLLASTDWKRISVTPVQAITSVTAVPTTGAPFVLSSAAYAIDIDGNGDGWVRVGQPGIARWIDVSVEAGMASDWDLIPEPLRLAVLRLTGHLHANRDDPADAGPPAAIAALLRPWRRMKLA
jgi:uncharacterized phiE125 gp8 family phage protein